MNCCNSLVFAVIVTSAREPHVTYARALFHSRASLLRFGIACISFVLAYKSVETVDCDAAASPPAVAWSARMLLRQRPAQPIQPGT